VLVGLLVILGGARVVLALVYAEPFGVEATLALAGLCLGIVWGLRNARRRSGDVHDLARSDREER
jgi:hypothetical protein